MNFSAISLSVLALCLAGQAATITYTYDAQHRLVQSSYGASNKVFYAYDAAGNVDQHVTITDAKYLQSWLWYFSMIDGSSLPESMQMPRRFTYCDLVKAIVGDRSLVM